MNRLSLLTAFQTYIETDNRRAKLEAYKEKLNRKIERIRDRIQRRETRYNAFRVWRKKEPLEEVNTWRLVHLRAKEKALDVKIDKAEKNSCTLITTAKDLVKIPSQRRSFFKVLEIEVRWEDEDALAGFILHRLP